MTVHLAVAGDVFHDVYLLLSSSNEMSWMRSWPELSQFLRRFLSTLKSEAETVIDEKQAGFRAGRSTTEEIFNL